MPNRILDADIAALIEDHGFDPAYPLREVLEAAVLAHQRQSKSGTKGINSSREQLRLIHEAAKAVRPTKALALVRNPSSELIVVAAVAGYTPDWHILARQRSTAERQAAKIHAALKVTEANAYTRRGRHTNLARATFLGLLLDAFVEGTGKAPKSYYNDRDPDDRDAIEGRWQGNAFDFVSDVLAVTGIEAVASSESIGRALQRLISTQRV